MPMQYIAVFYGCKNDHFQIKKIVFCFVFFLLKTLIVGTGWNRLSEAVLTSTHNLCFRAKIRKECKPQFCYIKVGCKGA